MAHKAVVGGADYAVGGWAGYEIDRRRAAHEARGGSAAAPYRDRRYIGADDALHSVLAEGGAAARRGRGGRTPLQLAAGNLAGVLARREDRLCDDDGVWECAAGSHLTIPPLTSADLRDFATDPLQMADPDTLYDMGEVVATLVPGAALPPLPDLEGMPPLPTYVVPISDDAGILRLEADVAPHAERLEGLQAALATRFDAAARALRVRSEEAAT